MDNSDEDKLKIASSAGLDSNTVMTMTNDGKVGIGTNSPTSQLHIYNDPSVILTAEGLTSANIVAIGNSSGTGKYRTISD